MKKEYKFSIIMSIYNVESYIEEALESIINQTIGFENSVQLILVNDGSTDNSEKICLKYKEKYPQNIIYLKKENGGLSSARNVGLKHVKGKYINFFDPDDILMKNVLEEVYSFFERNYLFINMVTIPLYLFEAQNGLHGKYKYFGNTNRIINLIKEPYNFVLSSAASFYKSNLIKEMLFDENMIGAEDSKFNYELTKLNNSFGYVCEKNVKYLYRKRFANNSIVDSLKYEKKGFDSLINLLELFNTEHLKDYEKEIIIYEIRSRLKNISSDYFLNNKEYEKIIDTYKYYLNSIDENFIFNKSKWIEEFTLKLLVMNFRNKNYIKMIEENKIIINSDINIKNYYINNNYLYIEVLFNNYFNDNIELICFDGNNKIINPVESKDFESSYDIKYGNFLIDCTHYRKFKFDLNKKRIIKFALHDSNQEQYIPINRIKYEDTKLMLKKPYLGLRYKDKFVTFNGRKFKITKSNISGIKYNFISCFGITKDFGYFPLLRLINKRKKKYK